jgi:hypothetical protein
VQEQEFNTSPAFAALVARATTIETRASYFRPVQDQEVSTGQLLRKVQNGGVPEARLFKHQHPTSVALLGRTHGDLRFRQIIVE